MIEKEKEENGHEKKTPETSFEPPSKSIDSLINSQFICWVNRCPSPIYPVPFSLMSPVQDTMHLKCWFRTGDSLPVIGEDFTLVCTFTPQTRNRLVVWERRGGLNTQASHDCQDHRSCEFAVLEQWKFSLLADFYSVNFTIKELDKSDGDHYQCTVSGTVGPANTGSSSMRVTPLLPGILFIKTNYNAKEKLTYSFIHITVAKQYKKGFSSITF